MKKETLNKIEELRNHINYLSALDFETQKVIQSKLDEIIICEMNEQKIGKFNLYDFCAKDNLRPAMVGVYHKDGYKYATDAYVLCKLKQDYKPELEDNIVLKDGSILTKDEYTRLPNYDSVIPTDLTDYTAINIDLSKFPQWSKDAKLHKKLCKQQHEQSMQLVCMGNDILTTLAFDLLNTAVPAMKEIGTDKIYVHNKDRFKPAVIKTDGCEIVIFPHSFCITEDYTAKENINVKWFRI
jgi:hypothetical protein